MSPVGRQERPSKFGAGSKSVWTPERFVSLLSSAVDELRDDISSHVEILERIEKKVDHTNGRVRDIEKWQIEQNTEVRIRKENAISNKSNYIGPIVSGLVVGILLVVVQLVLHR
jgi:hypothetical protein